MAEIVSATPELLRRFYGAALPHSARALIVVKDGAPLAVAGLYRDRQNARHVLFSDDLKRIDKRTLVRLYRKVMGWVMASYLPVHAVADDDDAVLLRRMGFVEYEGVWVWAR